MTTTNALAEVLAKIAEHVVVAWPGPYTMGRHDTNRALAAARAYLAAIGDGTK